MGFGLGVARFSQSSYRRHHQGKIQDVQERHFAIDSPSLDGGLTSPVDDRRSVLVGL
jgi:hypothetical protein